MPSPGAVRRRRSPDFALPSAAQIRHDRPVDPAAEALLGGVADTARACGSAYIVRRGARRVQVCPQADDGFDVTVVIEDDGAVRVTFDRWEHRFERSADPEDDADALSLAHDLVAAGLWGRARVRVEQRGAKPGATTVCFGTPGRWLTFDRQGGGLRLPWPRPTTRTLVNHGRPPQPIDERALRPLPWAPWAGIRGEGPPEPEPQPLPVDGELDLHAFSPKEVKPLVLETIEQHRIEGVLQLRIVHGKGIGHLRRTVHALLDRHPGVAGYRLGGHGAGSWGATLVDLHPLEPEP